jgi:hypothetical protein
MNLLKEIKTNLSKILGESTAYGLPKVFKSKRIFFKLFWLAFILFGNIASIYFIADSIQNYLKYEVIPKTKIIRESQLTFPTITFCSSDKSLNKDQINFCSFNKEKNNCTDYFQMFYDSMNGSGCLQFNSGKNSSNQSIPILKSAAGGLQSGLIISFKINMSIQIYIDDPSSISFIKGVSLKTTSDYSFNYEPYFYYDLELFNTAEHKLGPPYNPCYIDDLNNFEMNQTIINFFHSNNVKYKQEYCVQLCPQIEYINNNPCNCSDTSLGNVWRDCNTLQLNKDIQKCTTDYLDKYDRSKIDENCKEYCPLECDSNTYTGSFIKDKSSNNRSSSRIYIFFKELKYTKYSEIAKTEPFDFVSSIGGILGLFIGCSFVTLFELAELIIEICFILFGKKQQQKGVIGEEISLEEEVKRLKNEINIKNKEIDLKIEFILQKLNGQKIVS